MNTLNNLSLRQWTVVLTLAVLSHAAYGQITSTAMPALMDDAEMIVFRDELYMVLYRPGTMPVLGKFDGTSFTPIPSPAGYRPRNMMPMEIFKGNLYMIMVDEEEDPTIPPDWYTLFRYDGSTFTEVSIPYADRTLTSGYGDLCVYNNLLYIGTGNTHYGPVNGWVTFDGATTFTRVDFPSGLTDRSPVRSKVLHRKLYSLLTTSAGAKPQLISYDGISFTTHAIPDLAYGAMGSAAGLLILNQGPGVAGDHLVGFNGSAFRTIRNPPGALPTQWEKENFDGAMVLRMQRSGVEELYAFNGTEFTHIPTESPRGWRGPDMNVYRCSLYFSQDVYTSTATYPTLFALTYPWGCRRISITGPIREYRRFDFQAYANDRGWCWNEITVDWDLDIFCPIPKACPEVYPVHATLRDKDKIIWQTIQKAPFATPLDVADKPTQLTVGIGKDEVVHDLLYLDETLVSQGVEALSLRMKPTDNYIYLQVKTENDQPVPFSISLVDALGKPVWKENLIAPLDKTLSIASKEPGVKFVITAGTQATLESAGITATTYYPNPFNGRIMVDIQTKCKKVPVQVTIHDPNGNQVVNAQLVAPVRQMLEVKDKKPGIYVLTFSAGGASRKALIELKQ